MQLVVPAIRVRSYTKIKPFYEALGFIEQWVHRFEPHLPIFAAVKRDGMAVFLTEHTGDCELGALVHFYVADVDSLYAELQSNGITPSESPNNRLGADLRSMTITDPDGNKLKFLTQA